MRKDYGCGSRQRWVLNTACVRNLEANEEEMTESEGVNKESKARKRGRHRLVERTGLQGGEQESKPQDCREDSEQRTENEKGRWENIDNC